MRLLSIAAMGVALVLAVAPARADTPALSPDQIARLRQLVEGGHGHDGRVAKDMLVVLGLTYGGTLRSYTVEPEPALAYEICELPNGAGYLLLQAQGAGKSDIRIFLTDAGFRLVSAVERHRAKPAFAMPIYEAIKLYADDIATWQKLIVTADP